MIVFVDILSITLAQLVQIAHNHISNFFACQMYLPWESQFRTVGMGEIINTFEDVHYCGGIQSGLWRNTMNTISTLALCSLLVTIPPQYLHNTP